MRTIWSRRTRGDGNANVKITVANARERILHVDALAGAVPVPSDVVAFGDVSAAGNPTRKATLTSVTGAIMQAVNGFATIDVLANDDKLIVYDVSASGGRAIGYRDFIDQIHPTWPVQNAAPMDPDVGDPWYDRTTLRIYNGQSFQPAVRLDLYNDTVEATTIDSGDFLAMIDVSAQNAGKRIKRQNLYRPLFTEMAGVGTLTELADGDKIGILDTSANGNERAKAITYENLSAQMRQRNIKTANNASSITINGVRAGNQVLLRLSGSTTDAVRIRRGSLNGPVVDEPVYLTRLVLWGSSRTSVGTDPYILDETPGNGNITYHVSASNNDAAINMNNIVAEEIWQ